MEYQRPFTPVSPSFLFFVVLVGCVQIGLAQTQQCTTQDFRIAYAGNTAFQVSSLNGTCSCLSYYSSGTSYFAGGIGSNSTPTTLYGTINVRGSLNVDNAISGSSVSAGVLNSTGTIYGSSLNVSGPALFPGGIGSNSTPTVMSGTVNLHGSINVDNAVDAGSVSTAVLSASSQANLASVNVAGAASFGGNSSGRCTNSLATGLVFWLKGDQWIQDVSPSQIPVANFGASCGVTVNGVGNVCKFTTGDYLQLNLGAVLSTFPFGRSPRSMCSWATMPAVLPNVNSWIMSYGVYGATPNAAFYIGANAGNQFVAGSYQNDVINGNWTNNTWTHVCNVYDGTNAKLYVNGALTAMMAKPQWSVSNIGIGSAHFQAYIGSQATNAPSEFWRGSVYDVRVYNRALSDRDVATLMQASVGQGNVCSYMPAANNVQLNEPVVATSSFVTSSSSSVSLGGTAVDVAAPATFSGPAGFTGTATFTAAMTATAGLTVQNGGVTADSIQVGSANVTGVLTAFGGGIVASSITSSGPATFNGGATFNSVPAAFPAGIAGPINHTGPAGFSGGATFTGLPASFPAGITGPTTFGGGVTMSSGATVSGGLNVSSGSFSTPNMRIYYSYDSRAGCPNTAPANTATMSIQFTLTQPSYVAVTAYNIRSAAGRHDCWLSLDGGGLSSALTYSPDVQWVPCYIQWGGTVAAGPHSFSYHGGTANVWGCNNWGNMVVWTVG